jgi:hypothetical protein
VLPHLSDADLKTLELPMGPRKLVLAAIAELGKRGIGQRPNVRTSQEGFLVPLRGFLE